MDVKEPIQPPMEVEEPQKSLVTPRHRRGLGWLRDLLDLLFPRRCAICGNPLEAWEEEGICLRCLFMLEGKEQYHSFTERFHHRFGDEVAIQRAMAHLDFQEEGGVRHFVHKMKYHGRRDICRMMGRHMGMDLDRAGFFEGIDAVVPVPMHRRRQRSRGYNQVIELAQGLVEVTGLELVTDAVEKFRRTESQTHRDRADRRENVKGTFRIANPQRIAGRHVLLLDDVMTTGSTLTTCAKELLKVQGTKVSVLALSAAKRWDAK